METCNVSGCECSHFSQNPFKPLICKNCQHNHSKSQWAHDKRSTVDEDLEFKRELSKRARFRKPMPSYNNRYDTESRHKFEIPFLRPVSRIDYIINKAAPEDVKQAIDKVHYETSVDSSLGTTERVKDLIENTITTEPQQLNKIINDVQQMHLSGQSEQQEEVREVISVLAETLLREGIELDLTQEVSDLKQLHSLPSVEMMKVSFRFENNLIDGSPPDVIFEDPSKAQEFKDTLRETFAKQLKVPIETILITNLRRGSVCFDVIYAEAKLLFDEPVNKQSLESHVKIWEKKNQMCDILYEEFGQNGVPMEVEVVPFDRPVKFRFSEKDLDSRGNFDFPCEEGEIQERGGIVYYQPNSTWKRLGLKVLGIYENDDWLMMDGREGEWAVGFHGTGGNKSWSEQGEAATSIIASSRFFAVGSTHVYKNHKSHAPFTNGLPYPGKEEGAIYFTKDIEHCYILNHSSGYHIAFQCRINPNHFYDINPKNRDSYCVVKGSQNIRPYGICFKKIERGETCLLNWGM